MGKKFLYEIFDNSIVQNIINEQTISENIKDNLKFELRPYQEQAFKRYFYFDKNDFSEKPRKPYHLLFNMATGSGKTLIMAGLILYLYEKGYRNFMFFVNSNNIILKTKENFLNAQSSKYLFKEKIVIDGKEVFIKEVDNFEEADNENINIKFTTIQQLHIDLNNTKENSLTYEDFKDKNLVLIADEAHHLAAGTKTGDLFGSWEGTVLEILEQNINNILLEFTATIDFSIKEIAEKYQDKIIYMYNLKKFREEGFSKEINIIRSEFDEKKRIIQALILNLYRQELATANDINLKPVILFKAKRTIKESEENKKKFHQLIDNFSIEDIEEIRRNSEIKIIKKAFAFFAKNHISDAEIVSRTKFNFHAENCLSANNDDEAKRNQILLNTLEDENNPIRAIFAVQKLNEGWDVLNLFDIVRLYEGRDGRAGKSGKTTIAEAQLIGRGARYFPFALEAEQDKFTRKFDKDISNDLKVLEELYYHTKEDVRYISELKQALTEIGIYEELETKQLTLKDSFKETDFYKKGQVFYNKREVRNFGNVNSLDDLLENKEVTDKTEGLSYLSEAKKNFSYKLSSGFGKVSGVFIESDNEYEEETTNPKDINLSDIPEHIIKYSLSKNPFYHFSNITKYFPNINSISEFIKSKNYLAGLEITFTGTESRLNEITNEDYMKAVSGLLSNKVPKIQIAKKIKSR